jgi:hypothetical protein
VLRLPVCEDVAPRSRLVGDVLCEEGSKKVNWWWEGSCGKPVRREVRVVTAPVWGES